MASPVVIDFERLLAPISEDQPSGPELRDDFAGSQLFNTVKMARDDARGAEARILAARIAPPRDPDDDEGALEDDLTPPNWTVVEEQAIEILAEEARVLSPAEALPFGPETPVDEVAEETRLRFRYLDLRRAELQRNLMLRDRITLETRNYFHEHGFVHRDIKPSNIIIDPDGNAKITDFGIAHIEDPTITQQTIPGEILGTPLYMSPEQSRGRKIPVPSLFVALIYPAQDQGNMQSGRIPPCQPAFGKPPL